MVETGIATEVPGGIVDTRHSPYAALRSVPLNAVQWLPGFWGDRFGQCCTITLPHLDRLMSDPDQGHALTNLQIAAGLQTGEFAGTNWQDEWVYKWLEAAACIYAVHVDPALDQRMDEIIAIIAQAQEPDGYLATQITVRGRPRLQNIGHHELYVMGHLITAACIHFRATGKSTLLTIARKTADYLYATFMPPRPPELAHFCFNPSQIMALVELYRTVGDQRYLDLAGEFVNNRGSNPAQNRRNLGGTDFTQDRVPLREETEVVGHMVLATYLYAGAADVYLETGDQTLLTALDRLWHDLTERKLYVHGGIGPIHHGLSIRGDYVSEAIDRAYRLPNSTAYNETCAQIGNFLWNWRLLGITGKGTYADLMEWTLYNSIISGIGLDGASWFYTNVLRWYGESHQLLHNDAHQRFQPGDPAHGRHHICCPSNLLRLMAGLHNYCYSVTDNGLWVHLYGANTFDGVVGNGPQVRVIQETAYPWAETVHLTIELPNSTEEHQFTLYLRIPGWAHDACIMVNGQQHPISLTPGTYAPIERHWQSGDRVELQLPMAVRLLESHPKIEETRNQVAIARGPILYCLEAIDLPTGISALDLRVSRDLQLTARHEPDLLNEVIVLDGTAQVRETPAWTATLYRELTDAAVRTVPITLIPYYAWNNRGESEMTIWLALD